MKPARHVDVAWLAAFRALFGLAIAISALRFFAYGWIDPLWVEPGFRFRYFGFEWVPVPSATGMYALFAAIFALGVAVALGAFFRASAVGLFVAFAYLQLVDVTTYLNHYYLAVLLAGLLAISPAGRAWSVDARRRPERAIDRVDRGWLWLFRLQVGVVYFNAGLAKATEDWLVHAQPLRIWLGSRTETPILGAIFAEPWAPLAMSWAGFLFDVSIPFLLMVPRIRPWAFAVVIAFHAMTRTLFPIGMFSAIMVMSALVFFGPSWPRTILRGLSARSAAVASPAWRAPAWALAGTFAVFQVLFPLRTHLYGGDVLWHEQGMRWSWRVMVREKNGAVTYQVTDPREGRSWLVPARRHLTPIQERELSGQPDLILQLAHHVGRVESERVGRAVEVRAEALVSLNGRPARPLVDPSVDLMQVEDGVGAASWITPSPKEPPPRLVAVH